MGRTCTQVGQDIISRAPTDPKAIILLPSLLPTGLGFSTPCQCYDSTLFHEDAAERERVRSSQAPAGALRHLVLLCLAHLPSQSPGARARVRGSKGTSCGAMQLKAKAALGFMLVCQPVVSFMVLRIPPTACPKIAEASRDRLRARAAPPPRLTARGMIAADVAAGPAARFQPTTLIVATRHPGRFVQAHKHDGTRPLAMPAPFPARIHSSQGSHSREVY